MDGLIQEAMEASREAGNEAGTIIDAALAIADNWGLDRQEILQAMGEWQRIARDSTGLALTRRGVSLDPVVLSEVVEVAESNALAVFIKTFAAGLMLGKAREREETGV